MGKVGPLYKLDNICPLAHFCGMGGIEIVQVFAGDSQPYAKGEMAMGIWSRLFGSAALVENLTLDDESVFQAAMNKAVSMADSGNTNGVEAMRKAIRIRAGNDNISFYEPGTVLTKVERYTEARSVIIEVVRRNALLDDVYQSGDLISAFMFTADSSGRDARALLNEIVQIGEPSESHAFQLLFNELRCSSRLRKGM